MESNEFVPRRQKQQISVPFLWEEKPGRLKKDWSIETAPIAMLPSPAKHVVSVPFEWEEKPGKPILQLEPAQALPNSTTSNGMNPLPVPDHYMNPFVDEKNKSYLNPFEVEEGEAVASDLEAFTFGLSDEVPGMEATQFFDIMAAAWESFSEDGSYWNENLHTASETDDHSNSSGTAEAEISKDTSTVKYLFPVSLPDTSFLNNHGKDHTPSSVTACPEPFLLKKFDHERATIAKTFTLEELMMLSRKLSYRRKQTDVRMEPLKSMLLRFPFIRNSNKTRAYIRRW